jgi:hypothetical protein
MSSVHVAHATYVLDVTYLSYNQAGNYSTYNIHIYLVADSGWSGFASGIGWSSYANSGTFSFSGSSAEVANYNVNIGHDANGYLNYTIAASIADTGTSTYGPGAYWTQSGSGPRIPKVPSAPGISVGSVSGRNVSIVVTAPSDNGGASITSYTVQYSLNSGSYTGDQHGGSTTFVNLLPGTYKFRAYATNSIGNSPTSTTGNVIVLAGGKVWNGTSWTSDNLKVWGGSAYAQGTAKVWDGSSWVAGQ